MSDISLSKAVRTNLLSLQNTAQMMAKTQERLATGNKVNSALDNPTNFFTASSLNSRAGDMNALMDNMSNGIKTLEAADNGLTSITKTLESMQSMLRQARQDKSFQTDTYEIKADSTLKVSGGRFGEETEIRLQAPTGGSKSQLNVVDGVDYDTPPYTVGSLEGDGPRTQIAFHSSFGAGDKLRVDGTEITLAAPATADADGVATAIRNAMGASATGPTAKYTVTHDVATNSIIVESIDKTAKSPEIEFVNGVDTTTYGETSFLYNASNVGEIKVAGQTIPNTGGTYETFVASLQAKAQAGGYEVVSDPATQRVSLRSITPNGSAPTIEGLRENRPATGASHRFDVDLTGAWTNPTSMFGVSMAAAPTNIDSLAVDLNADVGFSADYRATVENNKLVVTRTSALELGPNSTAVPVDAASTGPRITAIAGSEEAGQAAVTNGIAVTRTDGTPGTFTTEVPAASYKFQLTYGTKQVDINIVGRDGSLQQVTNQLQLINDQLLAAGVHDVEASFDADDNLSFVAKTSETKLMAVSGTSAGTLFGTELSSLGSPAVSGYKSSNSVDQFVEEINRNPKTAGFLRASNDNGKLRIENLSTQELSVDFDKDGDGVGAATSHKIAGNAIRGSLAGDYNNLKNQLDRLSDDA